MAALASAFWLILSLCFGLVMMFCIIDLAHRAAHVRWFKTTYEAHVVGHHGLYNRGHGLEGPQFQTVKNRSVVDVAFSVIGVAFVLGVFPLPYAIVIIVEAALLAWPLTRLHETFHEQDHWLNRYATYREAKALHLLHHRKAQRNFGFWFHGLDRLFGTFEPLPPSEPKP